MARNKKRGMSTFAAIVVFIVFAASFLLLCVSKTRSLKAEEAALDQQIEVLTEQLEEERMRAVESQVEQRYYESDAYKESMARSRFNLIHEGDRLYVIE